MKIVRETNTNTDRNTPVYRHDFYDFKSTEPSSPSHQSRLENIKLQFSFLQTIRKLQQQYILAVKSHYNDIVVLISNNKVSYQEQTL